MATIKPLTLDIEKDLWEHFKEITPRTITLNDAIVELIKNKVKK
jgi:hypothetical protein